MSAATLNIVVVEDNDTLRDVLVSYLSQAGRKVLGVDCGEALNVVLQQHRIDLVLLDLNLPYEDGFSIAQRLKQTHPTVRIIMLTARVRPVDRTTAYETGVDVFLSKPTNAKELEAVIQNLSARTVRAEASDFILIRSMPILRVPSGEQLPLSDSESFLLEQLALSPGREMHTEALLQSFRDSGLREFTRDNMAVLISRLRRKLVEKDVQQEIIKAIRSFGYRLEVPLVLQ